MEQEQDFFSNITPTNGGLIVIGIGLLLLIGAIRRWKWALDMTGQRSAKPFGFLTLMQDFFGEDGVRVGVIIISTFIILGGIGIMAFM